MIIERGVQERQLKTVTHKTDLAVVGGGISGVCASIAAARLGLKVVLVQDRPVLGGNASSEVRLWILGATSHMGNNNRWAREGGIMEEILVENMYRNPEGNPVIFDTILLEKVILESNITLLLNTVVFEVSKPNDDTIGSIRAFCSQNQTIYLVHAPLFVDASGDGIVGFLAGAAFRMGAEPASEFNEKFAPSKEYGELLGHSIYFYSKDVGHPVQYKAPAYALKDISSIPRYKSFNTKDFGCRLWWIEYGGRLDTVLETEAIKWELWKVVYGVWDHIKNSGEFPKAENLTLEWVGTIPGKRESRRFEGDHMLIQQDIVEQRMHDDAVAYGGWSIDLHPADGVFSEKPGCNQWHSKGIYQIPYRCMYSANISNLFLAGRIVSASHVAFGSTRVMATGGLVGQAVGTAASLCRSANTDPRGLMKNGLITDLQQLLLRNGVFIPGVELNNNNNLCAEADLTASSTCYFMGFEEADEYLPLSHSIAQMLPLVAGPIPAMKICCEASEDTRIHIELRTSIKKSNHTPEQILEKLPFDLKKGINELQINFNGLMPEDAYAYLTFLSNPVVSVACSDQRISGILSLFNSVNPAVSNFGKQTPPENIGVDSFEFWCPRRRPHGKNLAVQVELDENVFAVQNLLNGIDRPTHHPNAWVADMNDPSPSVSMVWNEAKEIKTIEIVLDTDFDHPMESVLMGHPETVMPFCVRDFYVKNDQGEVIWQVNNNHHSLQRISFEQPCITRGLTFHFTHPMQTVPAAVYAIRCYQY
jgi:FAD dependent oxidoreductase